MTAWHPGSATPPPVGTVVAEKYVIEALLGRGGMGAVYRAQHKFTQRRVALKWLLADDEAMRLRFIREARTMGALEHPNVVGIMDIGEDQGAVYLVMEFIEGETLRDHLDRRPTPPARAIGLLMPALEGIAAAHQAGIVHRDLKPANLFVCLDRDGTAYSTKVLDFGVALSMRQSGNALGLTQSGAVVGTPRYMAPEQIRGDRRVDARADQFAMGLILYEALTGRLPYDAAVYEALVVEIATVTPPNPRYFAPELPQELADVVLRALAKDPAERFPDIATFARALEPFADGVRFTPPRQAHARRSMLGDEVAELAMASAALTPSRPHMSPVDERLSGPPTRALGGASVRASATTLNDVDSEPSAATRRAGARGLAPGDSGTSGARSVEVARNSDVESVVELPVRRPTALFVGTALTVLATAGWLAWRMLGEAVPAPTENPDTSPATTQTSVSAEPSTPHAPPTTGAERDDPSVAPNPDPSASSEATDGHPTAVSAEPTDDAAAHSEPNPDEVEPSGRRSSSARRRPTTIDDPTAMMAAATAMRAVGRSGEFSVEDF
ncbi:MAG: protein kinase [Sandaracinaceae bacterium]|nr:protein kinase [Sandaracinaceae bacterium]